MGLFGFGSLQRKGKKRTILTIDIENLATKGPRFESDKLSQHALRLYPTVVIQPMISNHRLGMDIFIGDLGRQSDKQKKLLKEDYLNSKWSNGA